MDEDRPESVKLCRALARSSIGFALTMQHELQHRLQIARGVYLYGNSLLPRVQARQYAPQEACAVHSSESYWISPGVISYRNFKDNLPSSCKSDAIISVNSVCVHNVLHVNHRPLN